MENKRRKCLLTDEQYNEILNLKQAAILTSHHTEVRFYRNRIKSIINLGEIYYINNKNVCQLKQ